MTPNTRKRHKSRWIWIGGIIVLALLLVWWIYPDKVTDLPSAMVESGEFVIDLNEIGQLRAEKSVTISAPPIRMSLQIITLVDEGTIVKEGDLLVQFDTTEMNQQIDDLCAELSISNSNLERRSATMESNLASLKSSVLDAQASYRLAELRLDQYKFEADVKIEEGKLQLLQSKLSLERAENQIVSQLQIDSAEIRSLEMEIRQDEINLEKTLKDKERLTIRAPGPGLVVYKITWRGGDWSKIKVGDTPWRSQALLELPDLSVMLVETSVNEVDVSKVKVGQPVEIKLEAFPEPTFHGEVIEVAALARTEEGGSQAKLFDILVRIEESDPVLKPGMTAKSRIIIDRLQDQTWLPIESVFQREDESIVWEKDGSSWRATRVELGQRNDDHVIIKSGIAPGSIVALVDPTSVETDKPEKMTSKNGENNLNGSANKSTQTGRRSPRRRR